MSTTADRVRGIVEPIVATLGLELFDVEHQGGTLRITVEDATTARVPAATEPATPRGVSLDRITEATRAISHALDEADPITTRYTLEVSSPGLERSLRTPVHFSRAVGSKISVKTVVGHDGPRRVAGTLVAADAEGIDLALDGGGEARLAYGDIERARTVFEWGPTPRRTTKPDTKKVTAS